MLRKHWYYGHNSSIHIARVSSLSRSEVKVPGVILTGGGGGAGLRPSLGIPWRPQVRRLAYVWSCLCVLPLPSKYLH